VSIIRVPIICVTQRTPKKKINHICLQIDDLSTRHINIILYLYNNINSKFLLLREFRRQLLKHQNDFFHYHETVEIILFLETIT